MRCSSCSTRMTRTAGPAGAFWLCRACGGRAATLALLERSLQRPPLVRLWYMALGGQGRAGRDCPACTRAMRELPLVLTPDESPTLREALITLDVCPRCQLVFFDAGEYRAMQPPAIEHPTGWQYVLAFFVPIEHTAPRRRSVPWLTWAIATLIMVVSWSAFADLAGAIEEWAFVPSDPLRKGGSTLLTSFFLHGGLLHLLGNVYFLLTFGDNVEDFVGRARYLVVLFGSAALGAFLQLAGAPGSDIPMIGASGGISGILAFYALRFPQARIGMVILLRWLLLPAWFYLAFWVGLQVLGAFAAAASGVEGGTAYLAHLGGAIGGVIAWRRWGREA